LQKLWTLPGSLYPSGSWISPAHEKAANMNTIMKQYLGYFLWWAVLVIIILILFGIKEYFAGFIVSQILVWSTAILLVYRYVKKKKRKI
jgi:ABC-type transport system involved in cytochrome bd biosynthesis fused ATPase/permease subunit